jgi:hypothetical protein
MLYLMMKNNVFQIWFAQTLKNKQILKLPAPAYRRQGPRLSRQERDGALPGQIPQLLLNYTPIKPFETKKI